MRFPASLLEIAGANSVHAWPETKSFKALGEEFETPPKFAENTYRTRGSQAFRVNKQLLSPSVLCRLCASCSLKAAPRLFARRVLGSSS